ncbi:hypothetical protein [Nostoc sp. NMS8]|uniref:hypothetical protein n=1 Tax=Nostoc sp. NMS8 TaxID=2815392 RepID=UPI00260097CD|nr:hypothetical protein [Nostoc sp. NMS8]MBN3962103.1 hypothetical protein [Nostoc sp. NMS8]
MLDLPQYGSVKVKDGDLSRLCDLGRVIKKPYPNRIGIYLLQRYSLLLLFFNCSVTEQPVVDIALTNLSKEKIIFKHCLLASEIR